MKKACKKKPRFNFPSRLHDLLSRATKLGVDHIVSWDLTGTKFIIHDQENFVSKILSNTFRQSKFSSFRRQLNAYGFERDFLPQKLTDPASTCIAYVHPDFKRDNPEACEKIIRQYASQPLVVGSSGLVARVDANIFGSVNKKKANRTSLSRTIHAEDSSSNDSCLVPQASFNESISNEDERNLSKMLHLKSSSFVQSQNDADIKTTLMLARSDEVAVDWKIGNKQDYQTNVFQTSKQGESSSNSIPRTRSSDSVLDSLVPLVFDQSIAANEFDDIAWDPIIEDNLSSISP